MSSLSRFWPSPTARGDGPRFPTRLQLRSANAIARGFTRDAVDFRRDEVVRFLAAGMDFIAKGQLAGIPSDYLDDFARGLKDEVSNAVGDMRRDLDNAGADPDAADVDVSELDVLLKAGA